MRYYKKKVDASCYQVIDDKYGVEICVVNEFEDEGEPLVLRVDRIVAALNAADRVVSGPELIWAREDRGAVQVPLFVGLYLEDENDPDDVTISMLNEPLESGNPALARDSLVQVVSEISRYGNKLNSTGPIVIAQIVWAEKPITQR